MRSHQVSESFRKRADSAAFWQAWVSGCLARAGLYVVHQPFKIDDSKDHSKTWDLDVLNFNPCEPPNAGINRPKELMLSLEVKSVNLQFTGPQDYPFDDLLVCSFSNFQKKWPGQDFTGRDFVFVSRDTGALCWLPAGTTVSVGESWDSERGHLYKVMKAKRSDLRPIQDFVEGFNG